MIAETPWKGGKTPEADAIVTATPGLAIGVLTADCAPVLFCDGDGAGDRRGACRLAGRARRASSRPRSRPCAKLGAKPERITAVIGPAISQKAYEVGADFVERFLAEEPASAAFFITDEGSGEPHFDLPGYVGERLARAGVGAITDLGLCTYCEETQAVQLSPVATSWRRRLRTPNFRHPARLTCASHA